MTGPAEHQPVDVAWPGRAEAAEAAGVACFDVDAADWRASVQAARDAGFDFFDWLSAVDESDGTHGEPGFDVVVHLARLSPLGRLLIRARVRPDAGIDSVTGVFPGAAWHERETWEMFGIGFDEFDDGTGEGLRPLLLPDGFEGTPLRKSFVLAARAAKPWPGAKDPGESEERAKAPARRKTLPPGVPDAAWGPHPAEPATTVGGDDGA